MKEAHEQRKKVQAVTVLQVRIIRKEAAQFVKANLTETKSQIKLCQVEARYHLVTWVNPLVIILSKRIYELYYSSAENGVFAKGILDL